MKKSFWKNLNKPFFCLAPMSDVTDTAFRRIIAKHGKPGVIWTEFVSADGLALGNKQEILKNLRFTQKERPIVAQLFGSNPDNMRKAARIIQDLKFDGVDINMGCPDRKIEKQGAGAALIQNPQLAREIIQAAKSGAPKLPVSVKTRIGYNKNQLNEWIPVILKAGVTALIIHWRTRKEMSRVPAKWNLAKDVIQIRDKIAPYTLIIGNGDISNLDDAYSRADETCLDGVMVGRGVFGNPWFFSSKTPSKDDKLRALVEHTKLYERLIKHKPFAIMKKHFKAYVAGWDGAKNLRRKLMRAENYKNVEEIIKKR